MKCTTQCVRNEFIVCGTLTVQLLFENRLRSDMVLDSTVQLPFCIDQQTNRITDESWARHRAVAAIFDFLYNGNGRAVRRE